ncbi:TOBE domain-containing protein [Curvibacter delicatus]|jgi:molybdate transport system regulatory protein|uniref:TOBE domain-containing protein n=1 Tax=Curvibacter delicatus TaxID=80879 RepID=UPI00083288ED|nr:TOBE domain-containing protein [Curvibacter delicatus]
MTSSKLKLAGALGHELADKRIDILRRIGEVGSISEAARAAGVSYKAAWQALDTLSNLAGALLVERAVGGSGGGGAHLTPAGRQLLQAADLMQEARAHVQARMEQMAGGQGKPLEAPGLAALGLRTSMRNQLPCSIKALRPQAAAIRVELALPDGRSLFSRITRESAQLLSLRAGLPVLALFKATAVAVASAGKAADGRNLLHGQATRVSRAAAGGEVALTLATGLHLVGFAGPDSGLKVGCQAVASVDESAVVIALAS